MNSNTLVRLVFLLIVSAVPLACSADAPTAPADSVMRSAQGLNLPGQLPVPCSGSGALTWEGNTTQLMIADAWAACGVSPTGSGAPGFDAIDGSMNDATLIALKNLMFKIVPANPGGLLRSWIDFRATPSTNCDPVTQQVGRSVELEDPDNPPVQEWVETAGAEIANLDVRGAGVNYCIAQRLRTFMPGAVGAQGLFLSAAEQRELLEVVRERVQIAVLQYATIGVMFATPYQGFPTSPTCEQRIPWLQDWALTSTLPGAVGTERRDRLTAMGKDFAGAVQLLVTVTEELMDLMLRSRSQRAATGVVAASRGQDLWGPASWHQRVLSLLYGGDPLADESKSLHPNAQPTPGLDLITAIPAGIAGPANETDWRRYSFLPYVEQSLAAPQVATLLALARQFNALEFTNSQPASCQRIDAGTASAMNFYQNVEFELRKSACVGAACASVVPPSLPYPNEPYLLWEDHGILPEHAQAIVSFFAQAFNDRSGADGCVPGVNTLADYQAAFPGLSPVYPFHGARPGAQNLRGEVEIKAATTIFSADSQFVQRGLDELATEFTRFGAYRIPAPWEVQPFVGAEWQGLPDPCGHFVDDNERRRRMGVISALVATRQAVADSMLFLGLLNGFAEQQHLETYFKSGKSILELITATVGDRSVAIKPVPLVVSSNFVAVDNESVGVEVTYAEDDAWWDSQSTGGPAGVVHGVFAVVRPRDGAAFHAGVATSLAVEPSTKIDVDPTDGLTALTIADLAEQAFANGHFAFAASLSPALQSNGMPRRWVSQPLKLDSIGVEPNLDFNLEYLFTIVAVRWDPAVPFSWDSIEYRLVASNMASANYVRDAQYFASGGLLGGLARKHMLAREDDPSSLAYDAFGFPTNWIPTMDAGLLGGTPGENSVPFYLDLAESSASDASSAVEQAIEGLLAEQQDEATQAAADIRAAEATREAKDRLCGIDNDACDTAVGVRSLSSLGLVPAYDAGICGNTVESHLRCYVGDRLNAARATELAVARAVEQRLTEASPPAFHAYAGGALQTALIEHWAGLKAITDRGNELIAVGQSAVGKVQAAEAALASYSETVRYACSETTMEWASRAGCSKGTSVGLSVGIPPSFSVGASESCSQALVFQQKTKCGELMIAEAVPEIAVISAGLDAWVSVGAAATALTDVVTAARIGGAGISELVGQAQLASRQAEVEAELASIVAPTSFGLSRRYRSYDVWRAKALLDGSRRYALAARRAIEARYVVDLSRLESPEPFVAGPAGWADEVYGYDLNLLPAVGLAVGTPVADGLHTTKVVDYVHNLQAFVAGFAVARPSAVAQQDVDVLYLPGLASPGPVSSPEVGQWTLLCADGDWMPLPGNGAAADACLESGAPGAPLRAAIDFVLDPWGRRSGSIVNPPYSNRYNVRYERLAVNLIGTGIKDCTKSADAYGCYNAGFVRYDLTHQGGGLVTDYDGVWRTLGTPLGRIEGGKALAAELWLDPLKDGWTTEYVSAVARTEFNVRPVGGAYRLELELAPEIRLDRLERVQLLIGTSYWVKQQ